MAGERTSVVVGMSGGVDSAVAAGLLVGAGYRVFGVTMRLWTGQPGDEPSRGCCSLAGVQDARETCAQLGIPHYVVDLSDEFARDVVASFVDGYSRGVTPNPCTICNAKVRFDALLRIANDLGADRIATGHYARTSTSQNSDRIQLLAAVCASKDQSYMLYGLRQDHLRSACFPLGSLPSKDATRSIAAAMGLAVARRGDSQDICFVGTQGYAAFLCDRAQGGFEPGPIVDDLGRVIGTHSGIVGYTVGQRRRLPASNRGPLFVVGIDAARNTVHVGPEERLLARGLIARSMNWVSIEPPEDRLDVQARIRYNAPLVPATICRRDDAVYCRFDFPQRAVAPGQAVVFYDGDRVLAGGTIVEAVAEDMVP